jgi:hypothetical protein
VPVSVSKLRPSRAIQRDHSASLFTVSNARLGGGLRPSALAEGSAPK